MPTYMLHGFRWPREGFTGIRVHAVVHNLEDCSVEYIQNEWSKRVLLESFRTAFPDAMHTLDTHGAQLQFIEQHDPDDLTGPHAVSQPHAFVADKVIEMAPQQTKTDPTQLLSLNVEDVVAAGSGLPAETWAAMADLRDKIAGGEKIGWWVVHNGDPERAYDSGDEFDEEEDGDEDEDDEDVDDGGGDGASTPTQATADDTRSQTQVKSHTSATSQTTPGGSAFPIPTRSKGNPVDLATESGVPPRITEQNMPEPKRETLPEPAKLKEVAQKTGFRKKFFGKKA